MAIKLTCPACRDTVYGEEADRGTNVKCGTCWADVPVPKADPDAGVVVAKALPATAKPRPAQPAGAKPPVATALPPSDPAPTAKPVSAKPATLNPIDARNRDRDRDRDRDDDRRRDKDRDRPRFKGRDEDDDDRPIRSRGPSGGGKGILIAFLGVGLLMLVGLVVGAILLVRGVTSNPTDPTPEVANNPGGGNNVNLFPPKVGGNPNLLAGPGDFNPNPQGNKPGPAGWVEFQGKGFALSAPAKMAKSTTTFAHGGKFFEGDKYEAVEGDGLRVAAQELTRLDGVAVTTPEFVAAATFNPADKVRKTDGRPMAHGPGVEFATTEIGGDTGAALVTQTANKVYVFHIRWKPNLADGPKKRAEFFNSVRILGAEGAGPDVAGGGRRPRPNPFDPFGQQPQGPQRIATPWKAVDNKGGFAADAPPGVAKEKHTLEIDGRTFLSGMKYAADDGRCAYWMFHHDLAAGQEMDVEKIARKLVQGVFPHDLKGSEEAKLDGKPATKWTIRHFHGGLSSGYSVKLGYRVFTFFVTSKQGIYGANGDPTLDERQAKFLNSIKLTFDPKTHDPYAGEPEWVAMAKTVGFSVSVPRQATTEGTFTPIFGLDVPVGKTYKAEVDGITYEAFVIDLSTPPRKRPTDPERNPAEVVKWLTGHLPVTEGPIKAKFGGLDAEGYTVSHPNQRPTHLRVAANGTVIYAAKVSLGWDSRKVGDKEFADKAAKFFDSYRTAAGGGLAANPGGEVGGGVVGASGDFATLAAGKVKPFWAAAFLPERKELITVGVRDVAANAPGGVLRRYSLPDFKLKATYHLPQPAHRAAADEKGGKLYVASVSAAVDARLNEREAWSLGGNVQVFDLKRLTDGTVGELEEVKPASTLFVSSRISGLEVSPSGDAVYVGCVTQDAVNKQRPFRGKLIKFDTAPGKLPSELPCDAPVWAIRLSADGRRLAVVERPTDATGGPRGGGNLVLLDAPNWKRIKSVPLTGVPSDVAVLGERAAALEAATDGVKLTVMAEDGETDGVAAGPDARYLKATRDGKRVLVSVATPGTGLTLSDVAAGKTPTLTKKATAADPAFGGLCTLSPDGKLAVLNSGAVIDLEKSGGK